MAVLDELFVKLGYDVDQEEIDTFNEGVDSTIRGLKRVAIAGIAAATGIVVLTKKMTDFQNKQTQISRDLDIPVEISQAWQDAAEDMGISAETAVGALTKVRRIQEDLAVGKPPSAEFLRGLNQIGISLSDLEGISADQALLKISKGLSSLEGVAKGGAATLLGMREELNFLGDPKLAGLITENLDKIDTDNLTKMTTQWSNLGQAARKASLSFANEVAPTIGAGLDFISDGMDDLRKNFGGFLQAIANDEINPIDDAASKLDDFVFGAWRDAFGKLLDSKPVQDFSNLANDALGKTASFLAPLSNFGVPGGGGSLGLAGGGADNSVIINNNIKMDISTDNPLLAGKAAKREIENSNSKAIGSLKNIRRN